MLSLPRKRGGPWRLIVASDGSGRRFVATPVKHACHVSDDLMY
jgi:hypothetical protein